MKVALLTFHTAANYGAALQAYALQKALDERGFENEYINYQNNHRVNAYSISYHVISSIRKGDIKGAVKYLFGFPFLGIRKLRFNSFYRKRLRSTKEVFKTSNEAKKLNAEYDKFIVGSDQVWNWKNNGGDHSYLLSFVKDNEKKISYSSSFGIAEIPKDLREIYQTYLSQIRYLSVREKHGIELVYNLTGRKPELVLDPVFLLTKEQWMEIADSKRITDSFIFSYTNKANQLEDFMANTQLDLNGRFIYKLSRNISVKDFIQPNIKVKYSMSPSNFLSVVRDAQLIVSASFHCVAVSIIMNKPFVAILTGNKGKDERLLNILSLLDLTSRIYHDNMTMEEVAAPIDYEIINKKINELKLSSLDYLMDALRSN